MSLPAAVAVPIVHAAVTDGYLVIFEKDFKRNFVHIRDVADDGQEELLPRPRRVAAAERKRR